MTDIERRIADSNKSAVELRKAFFQQCTQMGIKVSFFSSLSTTAENELLSIQGENVKMELKASVQRLPDLLQGVLEHAVS